MPSSPISAQRPTTWSYDPASGQRHQENQVNGRDPLAIFDEYVPVMTNHSHPTFTSIAFNDSLAAEDRLELTVRVDDIQQPMAASALYVFVETSADGRRWIQRSDQTNAFDGSNADIAVPIGTSTASAISIWSDSCRGSCRATPSTTTGTGPLLAYVRLRIFFASNDVEAHLRVYAHGTGQKSSTTK